MTTPAATAAAQHTLTTTIHRYWLDISEPDQARQWADITAKLKEAGNKHFHVIADAKRDRANQRKGVHSEEVILELGCLFEDQWNTPTERVFDWYEGIVPNKDIKQGHWLEITPDMRAARANTLKCGYCGKHYGPYHTPAPANGFCDACLDSPYLAEKDLYLTRLEPLSGKRKFTPLTDEEKADLMPRYVSRQTTSADSRAKQARDKERRDVIEKCAKAQREAVEERDGMLWLWDHGFSLQNVIYYSHARKFSFGWRSPVSAEVKSALLDVMSEFPFNYEIKSVEGTVERVNE